MIAAICFCSLAIGDARAVDEPPRLPRLEALERVDVQADERVRVVLGDLLDLDPALRREHEERLLRAPVEGDREVVLLRDVGRALDPEAPHDMAANVEAEDRPRVLLGLVWRRRELDATCLAATAGEHLRLDDNRPPISSAAARASSGVSASRPFETGMPKRAKSCCPGTRRDPPAAEPTRPAPQNDRGRLSVTMAGVAPAALFSSSFFRCSPAAARTVAASLPTAHAASPSATRRPRLGREHRRPNPAASFLRRPLIRCDEKDAVA